MARSVADQFTSLTNYTGDDYVMGHLLNAVRASGQTALTVNLLTGDAQPAALLTPEVRRSVGWYSGDFPDLVRRSGSTTAFVTTARMTVIFDGTKTRPRFVGDRVMESPYQCDVVVVDDRGKRYEARVSGWWYPETFRRPTLWSRLPEGPFANSRDREVTA